MAHNVIPALSRAEQFGSIAAAIDNLERIAGERVGGPNDEELAKLARLERRLKEGLRPTGAADWEWLARRLARAVENCWHGRAMTTLLKLAA